MPGYSKEDGNILKQFGASVKAGRDELRISQEALAEKIKIANNNMLHRLI